MNSQLWASAVCQGSFMNIQTKKQEGNLPRSHRMVDQHHRGCCFLKDRGRDSSEDDNLSNLVQAVLFDADAYQQPVSGRLKNQIADPLLS